MTVPTVRTLPAAPEPTDSPDVFDQKAFELSDSLAGFVADVNAVAAAINEGEGGTGTVTSVAMTVPIGLEVSGSPITGMGTFAVTLQAGYSIPTTDKQTEWDLKINSTLIGAANGVAPLNSSGQVPSANLPSYVDDVIEVANFAALPGTGEVGKIYITLDTNYQYRWSGSAYIELVQSPGTTDNVPEGSTNLYHTAARVRATLLTGFVAAVSDFAVVATDSILAALQKIQGRLNQLGTAANAMLTASATDTTAGRAMKVGDAGWLVLNSTSTMDANLLTVPGSYQLNTGAPGDFSNFPAWATPSRSAVLALGNKSPYGVDQYFDRSNGRSAYRVWNTTAGVWNEYWTTGNTSANIQALLGSANYAAARALLSLTLVTNSSDLTANSIPTVGWQGVGGRSLFASGTSFNAVPPVSLFGTSVTNTGKPSDDIATFPNNCMIFSEQRSSGDNTAQYALAFEGAEPRMAIRHLLTGSTRSAWREVWTTGNTSVNVQTMLAAANNAAIRTAIGSAKKTTVVTISGTTHDLDTANESAYHNFTNASAKSVTVRPNATHVLETDGAWPLHNDGTGNLTVTPFDGTVTIKAPYGGTLVIAENMTAVLQKVATNTYHLVGQTVAA